MTVVVEGLAALIHQRELRDLLRNLEDSDFRGRVRVAIPFLTREGGGWRVELMDLEDYHRRLQDLKERMEEAARASDRESPGRAGADPRIETRYRRALRDYENELLGSRRVGRSTENVSFN